MTHVPVSAEPKGVLEAFNGFLGLVKTPLGTVIILVASIFAQYKILEARDLDRDKKIERLEQRADAADADRLQAEGHFETTPQAIQDRKELLGMFADIKASLQHLETRVDGLYQRH